MQGLDILSVREILRMSMEMRYEIRRSTNLLVHLRDAVYTQRNSVWTYNWYRRADHPYNYYNEVYSRINEQIELLRSEERALQRREENVKKSFADILLTSTADKEALEEYAAETKRKKKVKA